MTTPILRTSRPTLFSLRAVTTGLAAASLAIAAALIPTPIARAQDGAADPPPPPKPVLAIEHKGLQEMFPDEKDAGLVKALSMLGARFKELKADPSVGDDLREIPDEAVDLFDSLMTAPMRMAVTLGESDPETHMPALGLVLSFDVQDQQHAESLDRNLEHVRTLTEMPFAPEQSQRWASMHDLALPFGVVSYGPRQAADGWRYELIYGAVGNPDALASYLPKHPGDVQQPASRAMIDFAALTPVSEMLGGMLAMFAPQGSVVLQQMRDSGLVGPEAMTVEMTSGYTKTHGVERWVVRRAGRYAEALGLSTAPLTPQDLAIIPADATAAQIKRVNIQHQWLKMRKQMEQVGQQQQVDDFLAQFREHSGVDLETDIIEALGDTVAAYLSDSSGGGSFLSGVIAVKLSDPQKLQDSMAKLSSMANQMAPQLDLGPGALRLENTNMGSISLTSLRLRGLPIPIEPSFAIAGDWLIVGACNNACRAGAQHAVGTGRSITENPTFKEAWPRGAKPVSVTFVDTPRTLRSGYTSLSLLGSAFSNFVASPDPESRDPGPMLGTYTEFVKGARPIFSHAQWAGEDLIVETSGDRSILVNVAGVMGVGEAGSLIMGAILGGGMTAAAMEEKMHSGHGHEHESHHENHDSDEDVEY